VGEAGHPTKHDALDDPSPSAFLDRMISQLHVFAAGADSAEPLCADCWLDGRNC
jgi:hypothetical protein